MYKRLQRGQGLEQGIEECQYNLDCPNSGEISSVRAEISKMVSLLKSRPHKKIERWFRIGSHNPSNTSREQRNWIMNTWASPDGLVLSSGIPCLFSIFCFPLLGFHRCEIAMRSECNRISLEVMDFPFGLSILRFVDGSATSHHTGESVLALPLGNSLMRYCDAI